MRFFAWMMGAALLCPGLAVHAQDTNTYKVDFTIRDTGDAGGKTGRKFSLLVNRGVKSTFKVGNRVPVSTGALTALGIPAAATQTASWPPVRDSLGPAAERRPTPPQTGPRGSATRVPSAVRWVTVPGLDTAAPWSGPSPLSTPHSLDSFPYSTTFSASSPARL